VEYIKKLSFAEAGLSLDNLLCDDDNDKGEDRDKDKGVGKKDDNMGFGKEKLVNDDNNIDNHNDDHDHNFSDNDEDDNNLPVIIQSQSPKKEETQVEVQEPKIPANKIKQQINKDIVVNQNNGDNFKLFITPKSIVNNLRRSSLSTTSFKFGQKFGINNLNELNEHSNQNKLINNYYNININNLDLNQNFGDEKSNSIFNNDNYLKLFYIFLFESIIINKSKKTDSSKQLTRSNEENSKLNKKKSELLQKLIEDKVPFYNV